MNFDIDNLTLGQLKQIAALVNSQIAQPTRSSPSRLRIGAPHPGVAGIYAGVSRGEDGKQDGQIVLLDAIPNEELSWADAIKWAESLGNGARLPTRFESALLYANVRDKIETNSWYWTGTQYSDSNAWGKYFSNGDEYDYNKSSEGRARAVRRLEI